MVCWPSAQVGRDVRGAEGLFRGVLQEMRWSVFLVSSDAGFLCDSCGPPLILRTTFASTKWTRLAY